LVLLEQYGARYKAYQEFLERDTVPQATIFRAVTGRVV